MPPLPIRNDDGAISAAEVMLIEWRHLYDEVHDTCDNELVELITRVYKQTSSASCTADEIATHADAAAAAAGVVQLDPIGFTDFILLATSGKLELPESTQEVLRQCLFLSNQP